MQKDSSFSTNVTAPNSHRTKASDSTPRQAKAENPKLKGLENDISLVNAGIIEVKRAKEEAKIRLELRFQELQK